MQGDWGLGFTRPGGLPPDVVIALKSNSCEVGGFTARGWWTGSGTTLPQEGLPQPVGASVECGRVDIMEERAHKPMQGIYKLEADRADHLLSGVGQEASLACSTRRSSWCWSSERVA